MIETFDCDQGSVDWFALRRGIPTASCFADILAGGQGKTRKTYLLKLAGELLTDEVADSYVSRDMERGQIMESEARDFYAFTTETELKRIGFIRNGRKGCSPDALIGDAGMLEIKTAFPHILIPMLLANEFPAAHKAQCQGALWVAEREWVDLMIYWPKLPPLRMRAVRDEPYIKDLASAVSAFDAELQQIVDRVHRLGAAEALAA